MTIYKKYCRLIFILEKLCIANNLEVIPIQIRENLSESNRDAEFNPNEIIYIRISITALRKKNILDLIRIIYHEFRHYWQLKYHTNIFLWWLCENKDLYYRYYHLSICTIETDADIFSKTFGLNNGDFLFHRYDIQKLNRIKLINNWIESNNVITLLISYDKELSSNPLNFLPYR